MIRIEYTKDLPQLENMELPLDIKSQIIRNVTDIAKVVGEDQETRKYYGGHWVIIENEEELKEAFKDFDHIIFEFAETCGDFYSCCLIVNDAYAIAYAIPKSIKIPDMIMEALEAGFALQGDLA
jgi:hypothetical protein